MLGIVGAGLGGLGVAHAQPPAAPAVASAPGSCSPLLNKTFLRLQDEKPQPLCQYAGKVILVVNTASKCGFVGQFDGLEALYAKYKDRGLVVLGFPSADFMRQEFDSSKQIADFCQNTYGVKFPMFAKSHVSGDEPNALFADLIRITGTKPKWNFYKYLIGRDGKTVQVFATTTDPKEPEFVAAVERALGPAK
ncbi:MAG: glutathione peroxidase [Burkholderiales bacterium]|nr:glutathione peroxidase [Burkholderiales bacterium]MDE2076974.1 glutathione peroxidase [Burkholderiales bacterium]MDE2433682.1 glutathione peroxidase [Burkholderiales bacterium]HET8694417.1 glutathione peroxidase [Aquabacterium sp.]